MYVKRKGKVMKKITINKKKLTVKGIMAIVLVGIMSVLIVGYFLTRGMKPEQSKVLVNTNEGTDQSQSDEAEADTAEAPVIEETPIAGEEENTEADETTTAPEEPTTARSKALIAGIDDENNWTVAIISVNYPLPDKYTPKLAAALPSSNIELDARIVQYYQQMYAAAKQAGCILTPYSGYHSYSLQETTYTRKLNFYLSQGLSEEEAKAQTNKKILPAGCSEHNAGIAVDIVSASADFVNTKEYQWLRDNAHNYGFVLRYPEEKEALTGVSFQPWHWRFVGVENAQKMVSANQCLEEFLGIV